MVPGLPLTGIRLMRIPGYFDASGPPLFGTRAAHNPTHGTAKTRSQMVWVRDAGSVTAFLVLAMLGRYVVFRE